MSADVVRFGDGFEVDRIAYQVRRSGRALRLERIPMETLLLLVERRGRLVSREEIIERIWGKDVFLDTDNSINSAIRKIRQALKDDSEDPVFIQTVTGKGYRFIANVTEVGPPDFPEVAATSAVGPNHDDAQPAADPATAPLAVQGHSGRNRARILVILACILVPLDVLYGMRAVGRMKAANESRASRTGPATGMRMLPLLSLRGKVNGVALSPDSKQIAFVWDGENAVRGDVYVYPIGGDVPQRITQTKNGFTCCASWSPDGHQLAFGRCEDAGGGIYTVPALGGTERKVTSVACVYAGWTMEVWKSRWDGSEPIKLTSFQGHAGTPRWSPDGEWIAFDYRPQLRSRIYVMNSEGRNIHMVTADSFEQLVPSWSRDGKSIYFAANRTGEWQVWRRELKSATESQITHHGGFAAFESDDGKTVYYSKYDANGIWSVGANGGPEVQLTNRLHRGYWGYFAVTASGLYFLDSDAKEGPTIMFLDLESHHTVPVLTLEKNPYPWTASLAASRDGLTLHWTQYELTSSIALATNFR